MRSFFLIFGGCALLAFCSSATASTIHVSINTGNDGSPGTASEPVQSLAQALQLQPTAIIMESGEYIIDPPVTIPSGVVVKGSHRRVGEDWQLDVVPTILLSTSQFGEVSVLLTGVASSEQPGAALEYMTINGGFVSVGLGPGTRLHEVRLGGGTLAAAYIYQGSPSLPPARIERTRITGGGIGISLEGPGRLEVDQTYIRNTTGLGMHLRGTGAATVTNTVIQSAASDGMRIELSNVLVENSVFRRNGTGQSGSLGDGIRVSNASPHIRGCFFELNQNGISLLNNSAAMIEHCTIVRSRGRGVYVDGSQPHLIRNIIAMNETYGLFEDQVDFGPEDPVPPPIVANAHHNLFWDNKAGHYYDADTQLLLNTPGEINTAVNAVGASANLVANPSFADTALLNYRLQSDSPALNAADVIPSWGTDIDGNSRTVGMLDLGAYERQTSFVHNFGTTYFDAAGSVLRHPLWEFNPASPFNQIEMDFLPGRLRFISRQTISFGAATWRPKDTSQPNGTIAILRARFSAMDDRNRPVFRLRTNAQPTWDIGHLLVVPGDHQYAPTTSGKEYEMVFDMGQGGFRDLTPEQQPAFDSVFNIDLVDTLPEGTRTALDAEALEIEYIDRATYEAQFTQLVQEWTFEADSEGWTAEPWNIAFADPIKNYNVGKKALELVQTQTNPRTYGSWASPLFDIAPGKRYMIVFKVSSSQPTEQAPSFRVRMSAASDFSYTRELAQEGFQNGLAALSPEGKTYRLHGTFPAEISAQPSRFFFDIMGAEAATRGGSVFLEEVRVYTTTD